MYSSSPSLPLPQLYSSSSIRSGHRSYELKTTKRVSVLLGLMATLSAAAAMDFDTTCRGIVGKKQRGHSDTRYWETYALDFVGIECSITEERHVLVRIGHLPSSNLFHAPQFKQKRPSDWHRGRHEFPVTVDSAAERSNVPLEGSILYHPSPKRRSEEQPRVIGIYWKQKGNGIFYSSALQHV